MLAPWKESYDQPRLHIKKQRHYFSNKGLCSQSYGFSSGHVWMWKLGHKEGWEQKNLFFWTVVLESPLDCKEIKPINPKGNQSLIFIGSPVVGAEAPILIGKDLDAGKDWGKEEKRVTEDQMIGWQYRLNGRVWTNRIGKPGVLHSMMLQRVRHDWVTELQPVSYKVYYRWIATWRGKKFLGN